MPRRNVGFCKPPEPSFITRMKQEAGFIEGPSVDTKRERLETADDLDDRSDDEAPTVVVLRDGDLTAEEAEQLKSPQEKQEAGGRIIFRKPVKRDSSEVAAGAGSSAETSNSDNKRSRSDTQSKSKSKSKPKQNTKLLSFQQDEDEEEN